MAIKEVIHRPPYNFIVIGHNAGNGRPTALLEQVNDRYSHISKLPRHVWARDPGENAVRLPVPQPPLDTIAFGVPLQHKPPRTVFSGI
jgi:hypothetical protein